MIDISLKVLHIATFIINISTYHHLILHPKWTYCLLLYEFDFGDPKSFNSLNRFTGMIAHTFHLLPLIIGIDFGFSISGS